MYVSINVDLLRQLVGYAESRAEDLEDLAASATEGDVLRGSASAARKAAQTARRVVDIGRRIVEGR